jgi:1,2-diacylglycerol 3-alpha-glucosyltransferase
MSRQRLRIAFVADTLQSTSGGGTLSGAYMVEQLRKDHEVITVATDGDEALPSFQLPFRAMRDMKFVMARPEKTTLAHAFEKADIVHLQFPFWLSFGALHEARRLGLPVVASFHVQPENALLSVGIHAQWLVDTVYAEVVHHLYNHVDAVICPTAFAEERLRAHGLTAPAYVVSNGVPPDVAKAMREHPPRHERAPGAPFLILAVGRFAAEKRQEIIIDAIARSKHKKDIQLVLSGWGPREAELKALASALPNATEIGFLSRERLLELYGKADLFVHAGEVELEGMSVLEAMSAGLPPVIADAKESAASRFALGPDFLFPAGDAEALAHRIDALIEDPKKLSSARDAYRTRAGQYSFEASVARLVEIYRTVIDENAKSSSERVTV